MEQKEYCYKYPHPAVTTDCVIFGFDGQRLKVLLIRRGIDPYKGLWALPGGFLTPDETAEQGAARELMEETGFEASYLEQLRAYTAPGRDPRERVITIAFIALVKIADVCGGDDAAEARWFATDEIPQLAFDHDLILRDALTRLREKIHFHPIGHDLLPEQFTMKELQTLYESILNVNFDRRNFAKKMIHIGILSPIEEPKSRPQLYEFNLKTYSELKNRGFRLEF
ncbi:MAG: NUDIX hydrolase [Bacteroides sp.]|nr:NUDIX hydrolase [Bacteroides sp.]